MAKANQVSIPYLDPSVQHVGNQPPTGIERHATTRPG